MIAKIVSGGQTGADRGGLDAAIAAGVPHGGWCPRGRRAEDGVIPAVYRLVETSSADYAVRTERNVVNSHCPAVFTFGKPTFSAEFGGNWNGTTPARLHADLHAGLWSNAMTVAAGAPFIWWFDFVDRYQLYGEYRVLASFMQGEDRRGVAWQTSRPVVVTDGEESTDVAAICLAGTSKAYVWVYDKLATEIMPAERFTPSHANVSCRIPNLAPGRYVVEYWSMGTGKPMSSVVSGTDESGNLDLQLPPFGVDIAGKTNALGDDR